jgi:predicted SAM-dependent methyltransferase
MRTKYFAFWSRLTIMNPISSFWLSKRHAKSSKLLRPNFRVLDIGARSEKIRPDALSLDIDRKVHPDVCASAEFLPFRPRSFDCISMLEVAEHLEDEQLDRALADCKRVAEYLVISTPNCDSKLWSWVVWPLWSHTIGREWIGAHRQFFGKRSFEELLEKSFRMKILIRNYSKWNLLLLLKTNPELRSFEKRREIEINPKIPAQ